MHRLFGKPVKAGPPPPSIDDTSANIGVKIAELDEKIKKLEDEMRGYKTKLKGTPNNATIKKRAMDCLRRKKVYEQQRDNYANQQFNIDQASMTISTVKNTQDAVAAMKQASTTLRMETKKLDLNEIENMQDELEDMFEDVGDVNEILGRSIGCPDEVDEADLDAELACLEDEMFAEEEAVDTGLKDDFMLDAPPVPNAVPQFSQPTVFKAPTEAGKQQLN